MAASDERFVIFEVGGAVVALPGAVVAEVLPVTHFDRPPGAPNVFAGFMNLGGRPLAVIAGAALFGAERVNASLYAHVLRVVLPAGPASLGLLVDRVLDVAVQAGGSAALDETKTANGMFVKNLLVGGKVVPLLDLGKLLLREEAMRIADLTQAAQTRLAGWSEEPA
jgi:purine-binding chemotaxis protein CheW